MCSRFTTYQGSLDKLWSMPDSRLSFSVCPRCDRQRVADRSGKYPKLFTLREFKCLGCYYEFEVSWQRRAAYVFLFASIQVFLWVIVFTVFVDSPNWTPAAIAGGVLAVSTVTSAGVRGSLGWFQAWTGISKAKIALNTLGAALLWLFPVTLLITYVSSCTGQQ